MTGPLFWRRSATGWSLVAVLLIGLGVGLRLYRFPAVPPGLNQDEAAAAYEAYSLLHTGRDRWGNRLPPYFPAWGSGQSVLLSYLTAPFLAVFGLSIATVRLPALVVGLLTLWLFFLTVRRVAGRPAALVGTVLLALCPWHVMLSRWALDANLLPFTLLLGTYTFTRALASESRAARVLSLLPFALTFYSYAVAVLVTPLLVLLLALANRPAIRRHRGDYLASAVLALVLSAPFGLFLLKSQVVKTDLGIERVLPFDLPVPPVSRLDQGPARPIPTSADFVLGGLRDNLIWNNLPDIPPLPGAVLLLALAGLVLGARRADPFALWLLSCVPLLLLVPVNVTRANAVFIPIVALAARAIVAIDASVADRGLRTIVRATVLAWLLFGTAHFGHHYFRTFPRLAAQAFNRDLGRAMAAAVAAARPGEKLLITESVPLNYVYYLFYAKVPPAEFQQKAVYRAEPGQSFDVEKLGAVYFHRDALEAAPGESVVFLLRASEEAPCPASEVLFQDKWWRVSRCAPLGAEGAAAGAPTLEELENATYSRLLDQKGPVSLKDGRWEGAPYREKGASRPSVTMARGFRVVGDLDGDASPEAVVLLARSTGGSGTFDFLAVVKRRGASLENAATIPLGDRVQVRSARIEGGTLRVSGVRAGGQDAACCPGELVEWEWTLEGGRKAGPQCLGSRAGFLSRRWRPRSGSCGIGTSTNPRSRTRRSRSPTRTAASRGRAAATATSAP